VPVVRPEAQQPATRRGLEERAPAASHLAGERRVTEPFRERFRERDAGHRPVREDLADRVLEAPHLVHGLAEVPRPDQLEPVQPGPKRGDELRQLLRRHEVERPAHGPGLDEGPLVTEREADVVAQEPGDAGAERGLRRAHDLRLDAHVVTDDIADGVVWRGASRRWRRRRSVTSLGPRSGTQDVDCTTVLLGGGHRPIRGR
jgi:hypothetical protein